MKVKFVSDSSCDIYKRENVNYSSVPLKITVENQTFIDNEGLDKNGLLDALDNAHEASKSACPSIQEWLDAFGDNDIVYVTALTSKLSGTYNSACVARDMWVEDHPDSKIYVFDSLSTGPELKLLMDKIIELHEEGLSFEEVVEKAEAYKKTTHLFFCLGSLHTMAMNGRVSKVVAGAAGVLGIRVSAKATLGEVDVMAKCRGSKKLVNKMVELMEAHGYNGGKVIFSYVDNSEEAKTIAGKLIEKFGEAKIAFQECTALCSYYAERNGFLIGFEGKEL